jgi:hypothetical protein
VPPWSESSNLESECFVEEKESLGLAVEMENGFFWRGRLGSVVFELDSESVLVWICTFRFEVCWEESLKSVFLLSVISGFDNSSPDPLFLTFSFEFCTLAVFSSKRDATSPGVARNCNFSTKPESRSENFSISLSIYFSEFSTLVGDANLPTNLLLPRNFSNLLGDLTLSLY